MGLWGCWLWLVVVVAVWYLILELLLARTVEAVLMMIMVMGFSKIKKYVVIILVFSLY